MEEVEERMYTDPMDLLPESRHLLEQDFEALGSGPAVDRQYWVAEVDSALSAAKHVRDGSEQALRTRYCTGPRPRMRAHRIVAVVDKEGSIKWKRRRRRL